MENNQEELKIMNENLDEDYLTRAKAAAYIFERQKEIKMNVKEMQYLAKLLNVDELHLNYGNGIINAASVSKNLVLDMSCHKQTFWKVMMKMHILSRRHSLMQQKIK